MNLKTTEVIAGLLVTAGVALIVVILWEVGKSVALPGPAAE